MKPISYNFIVNTSNTVKPVVSGHSKIDKTKALKTNGSSMKVESRDGYRQKNHIAIRDQRIAIHIMIPITRFNLNVRMVPLYFQLK